MTWRVVFVAVGLDADHTAGREPKQEATGVARARDEFRQPDLSSSDRGRRQRLGLETELAHCVLEATPPACW